MTPASAIRSSIDKGFRIRSRSEANNHQVESIQEARRKFAEKKAAQEEIRKLEKQNVKQARQQERSHRRSSASDRTRSKRSKSDLTMQSEKGVMYSHDYNSATPHCPPYTSEAFDEEFPTRRRTSSSNAKRKTHGAWTKFMMWIRTRFIRLGKKKSSSK
jgi:hypothetical protein